MSKIGKKPIQIPEWVELVFNDNVVTVKWPKGELQYSLLDGIKVEQKESEVIVSTTGDDNLNKFWWLTRSLLSNMIEGVSKGYERKLHIIGVGYGAQLAGTTLTLSLGLSHKVNFELPAGIEGKVDQDPKGNSILTLTGIDKQFVGEIAAKIKAFRAPEPYKGKGIRYYGEEIKLKPGKAAK